MANNNLQSVAFGAPIPGASLTDIPGNAKWEKPPQFVKLQDAMHFLMDQLTEPHFTKQLLQMLDAGMPVEAVARTILFGGFSVGKWTVDLALLMYKPLMLSLITLANRAGLKDTPVLMPKAVEQYKHKDLQNFMIADKLKQANKPAPTAMQNSEPPVSAPTGTGFMKRQ